MYSGDWVIKRYLTNTIQEIEDLGQTAEEHTRKTVKMRMLARNFSLQLEQKVKEVNAESSFGEVPKYGKIYHGETEKGEFVTVEGFIDGNLSSIPITMGHCVLTSLTSLVRRPSV